MRGGADDTGKMRGVHAGAIVLVGIVAFNLGQYAFHFLSARELGPAAYGDVVSLLALAGLIGLPLGGVQVVVARTVARLAAADDVERLRAFVRLALVATAAVSLAIALVVTALSPLIHDRLGVDSLGAILITAALTVPALLTPIALGVAQGLERFALLSLALVVSTLVRLATLVAVLGLGLDVAGALGATMVGSIVALTVPLVGLRRRLRGPRAARPPLSRGAVTTSLLPSVVGLLALTALTTADVIVAKVTLDDEVAGIYGSASLIGRVIFYLPAVIMTVLLPKVSARTTRGEASGDILTASIAVTLGASILLTLIYALAPDLVVRVAFGSEYEDAAGLLALFGIAMTGYAVLNVLLVYHLARGVNSMSWLLLAGAALQLAGYTVLHESGRQLLAVSIAMMLALVIAHEVLVQRSLTSAARRLAR